MSLRNRELLNLIAVGLLTAIGFASVYIARSEPSELDATSLTYAGIFMALYLAAHFVVRYAAPYADPVLLPLAALLSAIGVTLIYRLNPDDAFRQSLWIVIGVVLFSLTLLAFRRDYRILEQYKYLFGITAILLMMLPALPGIGQTINGARLWVKVGSFQFQPGELAKIFLIVFLAGYLRDKREVLAQGRLKDFGPLLLIWGAAMLVLVQTNDLGSALLQFGIFLAMLYVATGRAAYALAGLVLFVGGAAFVYRYVSHVQERVTIWLNPWTDDPVFCAQTGELALRQDCGSFQLVKSLYSIGNGGFAGTGLGKGTFTTTDGDPIIPYLNTDFIYSAIAQELGLVGAAGLLLVFMLFVARGFRVALLADDGFSKLLAAGLTFGFALQTFIIVGGVLRVIPLTGITLPFVSYGGSSVVANFILLALLLLVSNRANMQACDGGAREQADHAARAHRRRHDRRPRRRDDVLAGVGGGRPRRPAGQPDRAGRAVHDRPWRDPRQRGHLGDEPAGEEGRPHVLLPRLPAARARRPRRRLLDAGALPHGSRALDERLPDRPEREPLDRARDLRRQGEGRDDPGQRAPADARPAGAAGRPERARPPLRRGRRARAADREGAGDVLLADVRPESRREELRPGDERHRRVQAARCAAEPRHRRPLRPRLDLQGRDRVGRDRLGPVHARLRASSTPATARSTASG